EVLEDVRKLKSEVGIISFSGANESLIKKLFKDYQLEFTPLMKRETYVYVWKDHKFAGRKEISLDELKDYPCVSFNQSSEGNFYLTEEALSDHEYDKMIISDDRATTMEIIAELGGYSIGTGILSWEDAILQGLVSIKLKEEDPLIIGYITAKGSVRSHYGGEYIEELLRYKEI
ncbi:MAG: LysR family transcriptional regulator substrate-binding protein, partial [Lachnospiraceae bacterium]|nr:LysR family transcriptional regulator substrate-binding protein [Lachnospiraceae bacterium]